MTKDKRYQCKVCGEWRKLPTRGRPPRFCSTKCRMRAYRKRKAEARWNEWVAERMRLREEAEREYQRQSKDAQQ